MFMIESDTISAIATARGSGGIGIVRLSGPQAKSIAKKITGRDLTPRYAHYTSYLDRHQQPLDQGIALYFPAPNSFTGEDVVELQAHGGAIVLDMLLRETIFLGARLARPGEFSERAFLNNKIDLLQAEAIADIIESSSETAAKSALQSLRGEFSNKINRLVEDIIRLRVYVEAAIDFPEEEIDFLADAFIVTTLEELSLSIDNILQQAKQGVVVRNGLSVVIVGQPNAGKSSLLNCLAEEDLAIVNPQAGTTRDTLQQEIKIDGIPLNITDTAGLRDADDSIEQEGIRRAKKALSGADIVLLVRDINKSTTEEKNSSPLTELQKQGVEINGNAPLIVINNKIDLSDLPVNTVEKPDYCEISLSAKHRRGIDTLRTLLSKKAGLGNNGEGVFIARRRHIEALQRAQQFIEQGKNQLQSQAAGELLAEDLLQAQNRLGEITGRFSSDALLGEIFSSFCLGK